MHSLTVFLIAFCFATYAADDAKPILLTIPAQNALAAYEREVSSLRKIYDIGTLKAQGAALEKLEKEKLSLMQKGDLDGATALANAIKALNSGETIIAIEDNIKKQSSPLDVITNPMVGKWQLVGTRYINEFKGNGTALSPVDNNKGKWTISGNKFICVWTGDYVQTYILPVKNGTISGTTSNGETCTLTKVPNSK